MGAKTLLTAAQFFELPDEPGKQELLDGELIALPPAKQTHMHVVHQLFLLLERGLGGSAVWMETGYQLRRGWLQPDVSVRWPEQPVTDWMQGAPMLAIEVVSPANTPALIDKKTAAYLEEGAEEVWVVYPETRSMTVFRKNSWERITGIYRPAMFNVEIDLARLLPSETT